MRCLQRFHVHWVKKHTIFGNKPSTIQDCGCKQHGIAGVQLQSMLLTFLEKETESCEQVIFSLRMKWTVIQPYFEIALDVVHQDYEHRLQMLRRIPRSM
jgi:hypothetical protein